MVRKNGTSFSHKYFFFVRATNIGMCLLCQANQYCNGNACVATKIYNFSCSSTTECYTAGNLTCKNGKCDCPFPISSKMVWNPISLMCEILPSNCKEILTANTSVQSGIFYLSSPVGFLEAYCEMVINGGGYTFLPWTSLSQSTTMLQNIYTDTSQVLFRTISRSNNANQPFIITKQLDMYSNIPIGIKQNSYLQYSRPTNLVLGAYIFIGFLPASIATKGKIEGFSANGVQIIFKNCDG